MMSDSKIARLPISVDAQERLQTQAFSTYHEIDSRTPDHYDNTHLVTLKTNSVIAFARASRFLKGDYTPRARNITAGYIAHMQDYAENVVHDRLLTWHVAMPEKEWGVAPKAMIAFAETSIALTEMQYSHHDLARTRYTLVDMHDMASTMLAQSQHLSDDKMSLWLHVKVSKSKLSEAHNLVQAQYENTEPRPRFASGQARPDTYKL